jgi:hypothetical protein
MFVIRETLNFILFSGLLIAWFCNGQTIFKSFKVDNSMNELPCWDVWEDYIIICVTKTGGSEFQVLNLTTWELIRSFPRNTMDFVKIHNNSYYIGQYFFKNLIQYDLKTGSILRTFTLPYAVTGVEPLIITPDYFLLRTYNPLGVATVDIYNASLIQWVKDLNKKQDGTFRQAGCLACRFKPRQHTLLKKTILEIHYGMFLSPFPVFLTVRIILVMWHQIIFSSM